MGADAQITEGVAYVDNAETIPNPYHWGLDTEIGGWYDRITGKRDKYAKCGRSGRWPNPDIADTLDRLWAQAGNVVQWKP